MLLCGAGEAAGDARKTPIRQVPLDVCANVVVYGLVGSRAVPTLCASGLLPIVVSLR